MDSFASRLRTRAKALSADVAALAVAARDPRTPRAARWVVWLTTAYALSPIDLIPDAIPVLGLLDDLVLVPLGLALAIRLLPADVLAEARASVAARAPAERSRLGAVLVVMAWLFLAGAAAWWTRRLAG